MTEGRIIIIERTGTVRIAVTEKIGRIKEVKEVRVITEKIGIVKTETIEDRAIIEKIGRM